MLRTKTILAALALPLVASCTNPEKLHWFRNLAPEESFGFVPREACTPEESPVELTGLDYSLQMMAAVNNVLGHRVANPCSPFVGTAALGVKQQQAGSEAASLEVPHIARGGLIYR